MYYLGALKELYPNDYKDIPVRLGVAIRDDNVAKLKEIIEKYFLTPEAKPLFEGEIAYLAEAGDDGMFLTPAAAAVVASSRKALETILAFTGNPNARFSPADGDQSKTLLMEATQIGNYEIVKYLLEAGARPDDIIILPKSQWTALGMAACSGFRKILDLLIKHNGKATVGDLWELIIKVRPMSSIHSALLASNPEIINEPFMDGATTLLHGAAGAGDIEVVEWLVSHGAEINAKASDGFTPLEYAEEGDVAVYLRSQGGTESAKFTDSSNPEPGKIDVTEIVQRFEVLEDKFGIGLSALYATIEHRTWLNPPEFQILVNFDLTANAEGPLKDSFYIKATAYNDAGQLIGVASTYIYTEDFLGFDSRELQLSTQQRPAKIRLFPTK